MFDWGHVMVGYASRESRVEVRFGRPVEPINGSEKDAVA